MAEALVSLVVEQLGSIVFRELEQEVRLVVGVENEVEKLRSNLTAIQAVLADAETRQVKEATVRDWLDKLKDVAYDIEDVLDDWEAAILSSQSKPGDGQDSKQKRKVCSFLRSSCFSSKQVGLRLRHDIANKIKELNERLDRIAQEKERFHFDPNKENPAIERPMTSSMIDITEVKGRKEDKRVLVDMLLREPSDDVESNFRVLSIVGMGGIGKTTLAKFAFNHNSIETYFGKNRFWVCVSDPFDEIRVAKAILTRLLNSTPSVTELEDLLQMIGESIKDKRFLLVLDDVWEEKPGKWDQLKQSLKFGSPGSKVLVTTRKENVALTMRCSNNDILKVGILSNEECWLIVRKIAFFDRSDTECKNLEVIGREISKKCKGLPLAAKTLGGILQFRKTRKEWQSILESKMWKEVEDAQEEVIAPLWFSYYDLSPALKRCFSYCAIFSKDYEIKSTELIELWMAQGYLKKGQSDNLEIIGENYFKNLVMRSFFQDFVKDEIDDHIIYSCKMHDIVHDFAQIVARNECRNSPQVDKPEMLMRKVRHLCLDGRSCLNPSHGYAKKRSLLLWWSKHTTKELSSLFGELTHVRSLSLKYGNFAEIPSTISKLVQLRWLDLSCNWNLKKLPETLCKLHKLETIDITNCNDLELPPEIENLINLKHLHYQCHQPCLERPSRRLPKGMAQLTGLRTLEEVDVGYGVDNFSLGDLKNLNQLWGSLAIINLGAHRRHVGEAKEAELKKKVHLTRLDLLFQYRFRNEEEEEHLLEALEPSPNLEILKILFYGGNTFPGWMISLQNLRSIRLSWCDSCQRLPSLGKLPSLETLTLTEMNSVKKVGVELLCIISSSSSSSSSPVVVAFPKLTKLEFNGMDSWEEWDDYYNNNDDYNDGTSKPSSIIIMPSLHSLEICDCPRLKALPDYILQNTMLHALVITRCNLLAKRYNKKKGEDWSKISHIPDVRIK